MVDLLELAARVEALTGPDRGIDWHVHVRDGLDGVGMYGDHPAYTASIDAAMTLLPTDGSTTMVGLEMNWEPDHPEVWPAAVVRWYPPHKEGPHWHCQISSAATIPLALCHAALSARARKDEP